ncbi:MAG: TetR/AcrR family transcriptional regulator [Phycisphaerales bacterium]|jgi:AcrR family transcriptional regulator
MKIGQNMDFHIKNGVSSGQACERLLDAAEKLFSERGFGNTSVRDLTRAAGCNIAAVNYHFGGKDQLYRAMFQRHMSKVFDEQIEIINKVMSSKNPTLEVLLQGMIAKALEPLEQQNERVPMVKLIVRETLNPHMKEDVVELEAFKEFIELIKDALMRLVPGLSADNAVLCFYSLEGLILQPLLFYDFYAEIMGAVPVKQLVEHSTRFAATGIRAAADSE